MASKRDTSGSLILSGTAAQRLGISTQRLRQLHDSGVFKADRVTYEGVGVYYADSVEEFRQRRAGYAQAAPRLKVAFGLAPAPQLELPEEDAPSGPPEGFVE